MIHIQTVLDTEISPEIKTERDINLFNVIIENPTTRKIDHMPLHVMLHLYTKKQIINGFNGDLCGGEYYTLNLYSVRVHNWKHALNYLLF